MSVGELVELLPSPSALIPAALKVNNKIPMIAIAPKNKAAFNSDAGWLIFLIVFSCESLIFSISKSNWS